MAPLPANSTNRWFFDYVTTNAATGLAHTVALRFAQNFPGSGDTAPQDKFLAILTAIGAANLRVGWRVTGVRYQAAGTAFSLPVPVIPALLAFTGTAAAGVWNAINETQEYTFQGRSFTSGRKVDFSLYGISLPVSEFFRYTGALPSWLAGTIAEINDSTPVQLLTIDGSPAVWYPYMNVNFNSYWERRQRAG